MTSWRMASSTTRRSESLYDEHPSLLREQQQQQQRNPLRRASVWSFDDKMEAVARHDAQSEFEFIVKMGISFVLLLGLAVWFVRRFWHDKQGSRRGTGSRRRPHHFQIYSRSSTSSSSSDEVGNTCASKRNNAEAISVLDTTLYQRDAVAVGNHSQRYERVAECLNPMWSEGQQQTPSLPDAPGINATSNTGELFRSETIQFKMEHNFKKLFFPIQSVCAAPWIDCLEPHLKNRAIAPQ